MTRARNGAEEARTQCPRAAQPSGPASTNESQVCLSPVGKKTQIAVVGQFDVEAALRRHLAMRNRRYEAKLAHYPDCDRLAFLAEVAVE